MAWTSIYVSASPFLLFSELHLTLLCVGVLSFTHVPQLNLTITPEARAAKPSFHLKKMELRQEEGMPKVTHTHHGCGEL